MIVRFLVRHRQRTDLDQVGDRDWRYGVLSTHLQVSLEDF